MTKICNKCNTEKSLTEFPKRSDSKDGYRNNCKNCKSIEDKNFREENKDSISTQRKSYYNDNRDVLIEKTRVYVQNNPEKVAEYQHNYYTTNKPRILDYIHNYYKENKASKKATGAKYRAAKLQAIPKWADLDAIREFYKNCPKGYHVDHIIPLQGKNVCGLHILSNLQYLPASENCSKGNKFDNTYK